MGGEAGRSGTGGGGDTDAALRFARAAHRGATRRDGVTPYVSHVIAAAAHVRAAGGDDELVRAALLHDVVEHAGVEIAAVEAAFGGRVAALVAAVTEPSHDPASERQLTWLEIKRHAVEAVHEAPPEVVDLRAADLVANLDDLVEGHAVAGRAVWDRYEAGGSWQAGYYAALGEALLARLEAGPLRERVDARLAAVAACVRADGIRPRALAPAAARR